jgi:hypothetical protein
VDLTWRRPNRNPCFHPMSRHSTSPDVDGRGHAVPAWRNRQGSQRRRTEQGFATVGSGSGPWTSSSTASAGPRFAKCSATFLSRVPLVTSTPKLSPVRCLRGAFVTYWLGQCKGLHQQEVTVRFRFKGGQVFFALLPWVLIFSAFKDRIERAV